MLHNYTFSLGSALARQVYAERSLTDVAEAEVSVSDSPNTELKAATFHLTSLASRPLVNILFV